MRLLVACVALAALAAAPAAEGARILALFPIPGRSHFIVTSSLARALAERGHEVVVVSSFKTPSPPPNYTDITLPDPMRKDGVDFYSLGNMPPVSMLIYMWTMSVDMCRSQLSDPQLQALLADESQHFDLVLMEAFFNECFLGFVHRFKAPLVQLSAFGGATWMADWVGAPVPLAYVPDPFLDFSDHMTFWQRAVNVALGTAERVGRALYYMPRVEAVAREAFGDPSMPPLVDIERNTSLVLLNNHFSVSYPRPTVPAYVEVGGLHIKPAKALPQELKAWLDAAPEGFIYFSMGSNLRSADMPAAKRDAFLAAFGALPRMRVLWKWEEDALPGQPPNVRLAKWLPQPDVLAHPKLRVFVTHGGLMSTQEAVYHGVPLVGIPVFGDQQLNMARAEAAGLGVSLPFADVQADALLAALRRVATDAAFRDAARRVSARFHDRPRPPMDDAVFWTEYAMRHGGARHLRAAALDLSWPQYLLLDVVAAAAAALALGALLALCAARALLRRLCRRAPQRQRAKPSAKRD